MWCRFTAEVAELGFDPADATARLPTFATTEKSGPENEVEVSPNGIRTRAATLREGPARPPGRTRSHRSWPSSSPCPPIPVLSAYFDRMMDKMMDRYGEGISTGGRSTPRKSMLAPSLSRDADFRSLSGSHLKRGLHGRW